MPSLSQDIHIEGDIEERVKLMWDYKPTRGPVNQEYVVMCIVAPEGTRQKFSDLAIKVFGCFPTRDEADKYCNTLSNECDAFDYYVATTKDWLKLPPQVESIDDVHYQEGALSDIQQRLIDMRTARAKLMQERIVADREARKKKVEEIEQSKEDEKQTDPNEEKKSDD